MILLDPSGSMLAAMGSRNIQVFLEPGTIHLNEFTLMAPTGYHRLWHVQVRGILRAA
jgi:hypothetical protein